MFSVMSDFVDPVNEWWYLSEVYEGYAEVRNVIMIFYYYYFFNFQFL